MSLIEVINCYNSFGEKNVGKADIFNSLEPKREKSPSAEPQPAPPSTPSSKGKRRFTCRNDGDHLLTARSKLKSRL